MPTLSDMSSNQARYLDAMTAAFEDHLRQIIARATARLNAFLHSRLTLDGGEIVQTAGNQRLLRNLDKKFMQFMDEAGYGRLLRAFTSEFAGQLPLLHDILAYLSDSMKIPIGDLTFTADDLRVFGAVKLNSQAGLEAAMQSAAASAVQRGMFSIGGLKFGELTTMLSDALHASVPRAATLAETSMMVFFRTATNQTFQAIEESRPRQVFRYRYFGPDDRKTRPYCHEMLRRTKEEGLTREQIDQTDNGQLPNPFMSGGGFNCRHSFLIDVRALELKAAA